MNKWISTKDELPGCKQKVFVSRGSEVKMATLQILWIDESGYARNVDFYDHWMSFPEAPNMETEE